MKEISGLIVYVSCKLSTKRIQLIAFLGFFRITVLFIKELVLNKFLKILWEYVYD